MREREEELKTQRKAFEIEKAALGEGQGDSSQRTRVGI